MTGARTGVAKFPRWVDLTMPARMEDNATTVLDFVHAGNQAVLDAFATASLVRAGTATPTAAEVAVEARALKDALTLGIADNKNPPATPPLPPAAKHWVSLRWAGTYVDAMQRFSRVLLDEDATTGVWEASSEGHDVIAAYFAKPRSASEVTTFLQEVADDYNAYVQQPLAVGAVALWVP